MSSAKVTANATLHDEEEEKEEDEKRRENVLISKHYEYEQAEASNNGNGGHLAVHDKLKETDIDLNHEADTKHEANEQEQPVGAMDGTKKRFAEQMSATQRVFDPQSNEAVLQRDIPNKIIVARGKKISFYYERARRILRLFDGMIVTGFGATVCVACSLVEVLRRNEMAVITHVETKFDSPINYVSINEHFNNPQQQAYYENAPPQTAIEFHLAVGKYGKYLSGYHQRKMIEVFEKYDRLTGVVSVDDVRCMNLYNTFYCNANQIAMAEQFLADCDNLHGPDHSFILPDFIRYCSLIIHPLIKDNIFKRILSSKFGIGAFEKPATDDEDDGDDGDGNANSNANANKVVFSPPNPDDGGKVAEQQEESLK